MTRLAFCLSFLLLFACSDRSEEISKAQSSAEASSGGHSSDAIKADVEVPSVLIPVQIPGLIAMYPWNGNENDASPNHFDGSPNGDVMYGEDRCGKPHSALVLNGTDAFVSLGQSRQLMPKDAVSISLWVRLETTAPKYQNLISNHARNETTIGYTYILRFAQSQLQFLVEGVYGVGKATYAETAATEQLGKWTHVAAVHDSKSIQLYVNGKLAREVSFSEPMQQNENPILIGSSGYGEFFQGAIDDTSLYHRALDATTIASLSDPRCDVAPQ